MNNKKSMFEQVVFLNENYNKDKEYEWPYCKIAGVKCSARNQKLLDKMQSANIKSIITREMLSLKSEIKEKCSTEFNEWFDRMDKADIDKIANKYAAKPDLIHYNEDKYGSSLVFWYNNYGKYEFLSGHSLRVIIEIEDDKIIDKKFEI